MHQIGRLIGVLTEGLECMLFNDLDELVPAGVLKMGGLRGDIIDFAVLDFGGTVLEPKNRMVVHIETMSKHKVCSLEKLISDLTVCLDCPD